MQETRFRRSSFCTDAHGCVEVAFGANNISVRDSKDRYVTALTFDREEWAAFLQGVKAGEFDS